MNHLGGQGYSRFWTRWQQKEPCLYGNLLLLCTRRKPPRDLEIEHVSRKVASVYSHMLNWHWLSQLHSGIPMHWPLQVNRNEGTRNPTLVPEDKLALCIGRTLWKDFVTFSICQYSILVSTYPVATGGNNMRVCHVGKVYNFCRRSNSKYLVVSPVMDNTEQLRPKAMEHLDIPIYQSKTWVSTRD